MTLFVLLKNIGLRKGLIIFSSFRVIAVKQYSIYILTQMRRYMNLFFRIRYRYPINRFVFK
jgi:hypothetical protein